MKSKFLIMALISTILVSCTKEKTNSIDVPSSLIAKWNWIYSTGGYAGITYTPTTTGEVRRIEFDSNHNYKYYVNDILKTGCKFDIQKLISITNHDSIPTLIMNAWPSRQSIWFRSSDTLILFEEYYDGFEHHYTRMK